jgi:hypothetical protein
MNRWEKGLALAVAAVAAVLVILPLIDRFGSKQSAIGALEAATQPARIIEEPELPPEAFPDAEQLFNVEEAPELEMPQSEVHQEQPPAPPETEAPESPDPEAEPR